MTYATFPPYLNPIVQMAKIAVLAGVPLWCVGPGSKLLACLDVSQDPLGNPKRKV
jgi:hypothetical protein